MTTDALPVREAGPLRQAISKGGIFPVFGNKNRIACCETKPAALAVDPVGIPARMKETRRFVVWKFERDDGRWTKILYNPATHRKAASTDPNSWTDFETAWGVYATGRYDGLGFVLGDGWAGVDLDDCRKPETGELLPWATGFVNDLDSYTEISPSGSGVKIFLLGKLPANKGKKADPVELYDHGRYFCLTGNPVDNHLSVNERQEALETFYRQIEDRERELKPSKNGSHKSPATNGVHFELADQAIINLASRAKNAAKFKRLWAGDTGDHAGDDSRADSALCCILSFFTRDAAQIDRLFRQSGLFREKWERPDYSQGTIARALELVTESYRPSRQMKKAEPSEKLPIDAESLQRKNNLPEVHDSIASWDPPIPLGQKIDVPNFPTDLLSPWLAEWVEAESVATQTPPDLAGSLALAIAGAALAKKYRVRVRAKWSEPTNLFCVIALEPGERKSAVFSHALEPVANVELLEQERMAPLIAEAESKKRRLEERLKKAEKEAAKVEDQVLADNANAIARELQAFQVPAMPQLYCDDVTPEKLINLIAIQGGKMLQAAAEGTAFEVAKGRYSETANFDVFLKGHAGDPLRVDRISRASDACSQPALSLALAVQPDVVNGLGENPSMRRRGFLARFFYSVPTSIMGSRQIAPDPVPDVVERLFNENIAALWRLPGEVNENGKPVPKWLNFSPEANQALRRFEVELEPRLAKEGDLKQVADWAAKLAGGIARVAAIFHVADTIEIGFPDLTIDQGTVERAIRLGRDYLLPHALAAFQLMAADPKVEDARRVIEWIGNSLKTLKTLKGVAIFSQSEIHSKVFGGSRKVEELDEVKR
jgi:hypothetical protein